MLMSFFTKMFPKLIEISAWVSLVSIVIGGISVAVTVHPVLIVPALIVGALSTALIYGMLGLVLKYFSDISDIAEAQKRK